jgi:hypothetical protein
MSDFKPNTGSFTAYLEYMQRGKSESAAAPSVSPITLLEVLARQPQRAMAMADLETLSGMESGRFRNALKSLMDAGYVTVQGPMLEEAVQLTDKGAEAASLARPA